MKVFDCFRKADRNFISRSAASADRPPQRGKKHPRLSPQAVEELFFVEITVSLL